MLLVAEIGLNHDGDWELARQLIQQAKQAGADLAKFQFGWRSGPSEINAMDEARTLTLKRWCDQAGIEMFASIFSDEALTWAHAVGLSRYKIASRTVVDRPDLCERILAEGKETYVSLGMWDKPGWPFGPPQGQLYYIYCRSKYPTEAQDLVDFPDRFDRSGFFGYSDHCRDLAACFCALSRGASYIEKHFTLNKESQVIRDHALSATPEEFRTLRTLQPSGGQLSG